MQRKHLIQFLTDVQRDFKRLSDRKDLLEAQMYVVDNMFLLHNTGISNSGDMIIKSHHNGYTSGGLNSLEHLQDVIDELIKEEANVKQDISAEGEALKAISALQALNCQITPHQINALEKVIHKFKEKLSL